MLFHVTQTHTPESCPKDEGGSKALYDPEAEKVTLLAMYGAFSEHTVYYILEAETIEAVDRFLMPGFKRCTSRITPVSQTAIVN